MEEKGNGFVCAFAEPALASWLKQNYEIPDRRGQKGYESWEDHGVAVRDHAD